MEATADIELDIEALIAEIGRYLAAVETFRAEEREPLWLPETLVVGR